MDEYWDLFDENRNYLGITHKRGDHVPAGMYHLVVHAWIMDKSGHFLISQRQKGRTDELLWERTGGSVLVGETSLEGALREIKEELGLDLHAAPNAFIKSEKRERYHDFYDSWLFLVETMQVHCKTNETEVRTWKWVTLEELKQLKEENKLVKSSEYFEEVYSSYLKMMSKNEIID